MSRRLKRGGRLPRINQAVDAYNFISAFYGVPAGAFDTERIKGPVAIRLAREGDTFTPLGEPDKLETPTPGEVVYALDQTILTRHRNHRDSDHTKVTENSNEVVFIIERVSAAAVSSDRLAEAQEASADLVKPHTKKLSLALVDRRNPVTHVLSQAAQRLEQSRGERVSALEPAYRCFHKVTIAHFKALTAHP